MTPYTICYLLGLGTGITCCLAFAAWRRFFALRRDRIARRHWRATHLFRW